MIGPGTLFRHLHTATLVRDGGGLTDAQFLGLFIERCDEAAFEALVRRHGPMVLGVCRRVLHNHHDAEDAFQATFLVLARKATSIAPRAMVGNWLYGVAYRTAMKARAASTRRRVKEKQVRVMPEPEAVQQSSWCDLEPLLDQEMERLPGSYRAAVVLCDLEGKTHQEAARQLGWPVGTLSTRLVRARALLAKRLSRHRLALSAGSLAVVVSANAASACVPASLMISTVKAATLIAAGQTMAGVVSAPVAALTEGVLKAMLLAKLKIATAVLLAVGILGLGAGVLTQVVSAEGPAALAAQRREGEQAREPKTTVSGVVKAVDAAKNTVTITVHVARTEPAVEKVFELSKDAKVLLNDKQDRRTPPREGKLADLLTGTHAVLELTADGKAAATITARGPSISGAVKGVDAAKNTLTVRIGRDPEEDKTFEVSKDAPVLYNEGVGRGSVPKEIKLADLPEGVVVALNLSVDQKSIVGILTNGPSVVGVVKAVDAAKNKIIVTVNATRTEAGEDKTYEVAKSAQVVLEEGKASKLDDVKADLRVTLRLSLDKKAVQVIDGRSR